LLFALADDIDGIEGFALFLVHELVGLGVCHSQGARVG
jgi:hypothetical protein